VVGLLLEEHPAIAIYTEIPVIKFGGLGTYFHGKVPTSDGAIPRVPGKPDGDFVDVVDDDFSRA
jgi:hypothetical protein